MYSEEFEQKCSKAVSSASSKEAVALFLAECCGDVRPTLYGVSEGQRASDDYRLLSKMALLQCALEVAKLAFNVGDRVNENATSLIESVGEYLASDVPVAMENGTSENPAVSRYMDICIADAR